MSKLRFRVVSFSSEDDDHPASQLNVVNPSTKGWHSVRWCTYPQELGFELIDGDAHMSQIQILSHQSKISTKVEIFVGKGEDYDSAVFKRLGYLSLDSNERSTYNARELKTVFVDYVGRFLKLKIGENHVNKMNIYNQVGIIAVSILGDENENEQEAKSSSKQVATKSPGHKKQSSNPYNDLSVDLILDPSTANKLRQLADAKTRAVDEEDYATAKAIKAVEQDLRQAGSRLAQIDMNKAQAVADEDYDLAKEYKDQADEMRREIEAQIMAIQIPGMKPSRQVPAKAPPKVKSLGDYYGGGNTPAPVGNDDIAVGGGGGSQFAIDGSIPSKRVAKVETHHLDEYDDNNMDDGHEDDDRRYAAYEDPDAHLNAMDRPIKPKSSSYAPIEGNIDDDPMGYNGPTGASGAAGPQFPAGQHPLQGVENCENFDVPNDYAGKSKEICESSGIAALIGEHRSKCLFSKTWQVREAALAKVLMMFQQDFVQQPGITQCISALCAIIKIGAEDKIQQVLLGAIALLEEVLKAARSAKLARGVVAPLCDPILVQFFDKLNDGNARIREIARRGIDVIAGSPVVGPSVIASHCYRPLAAKQKTAWRPLQARISLLSDLVADFGLNNNAGLTHEGMLSFTKNNGAFAHSNNEVRDAAKMLVLNIYKLLKQPGVESIMSELRAKQKVEYTAAFEAINNGETPTAAAAVGSAAATGSAVPSSGVSSKASAKPAPSSESQRTDKQLQHATHSPAGKVNTSSVKNSNSKNGYDNPNSSSQEGKGGEPTDYTTCMFCSMANPQWTETDLDVHYYKECPLLISCPSCAQIVEIAGLPEHQLDECDAKEAYVPCDVTGLAIRATEIDEWKNSANCRPAPKNCMYCPLCLSSVEDSDDAWVRHLTSGCPKNTRTNGSS